MEDLNEEIKQKQKKIALKKQQEKAKKQPVKKAQKPAENKKAEKTNKEEKTLPKVAKAAKPAAKTTAIKKEDGSVVIPAKNGKSVKITLLGGVGEIGKNMTAIEYDNEMIVIDCGLAFPTGDFPGVDLIVPDISYLTANRHKLKGILITHGHEDHIGALPFVLNELKVPVYGSAMTLALVQNKLKEYPKIEAKLVTVKPKNLLKVGAFQVEFIKVSHSIAGALALSINTPCGTIVHTGDFKIDFFPIDGVITDLTRLGELGKKGINLLLCESTNVCRKGYSMSERNVGKALEEIFETHKENRLFVATFASNIHRMQQLLWLAEKFKRKVAFSGRSMINVSEAAMKIGELSFDKSNLIDIDKIDKYADSELLIITTGSQGEPMSALTRMAYGEFPKVKIGEGDVVVFSSSPIPGNEKSVYNVINALFKSGADVIYDELADVHASGHACQEEIKTIHALANPKFFIPVHGEYRHLKRHKELAITMGMNGRDVIIPDLGMQVEMTENYIRQSGYVTAGIRLVDGSGLGDLGSNVLKERKTLSEEGFCVAVLNMSELASEHYEPIIITRGVVYDKEAEAFNADAKATMVQVLREQDLQSFDPTEIRNIVKKSLSNFIYKRSKRRPIIIVILSAN